MIRATATGPRSAGPRSVARGARAWARGAVQSLRTASAVLVGCLVAVVGAAFGIGAEQTAYLAAYGFDPGFVDSVLWLFSSHRGVPLAWCAAPAALMLWLVAAGAPRRSAAWAVRHRSARALWAEDVADVVAGAAAFAAATTAAACAAALAFSGGAPADFGAHSIFAALTGATLDAPPSEPAVVAACAALAFLVLCVYGVAFQLGRLVLKGPAVPFIALVLLGLPAVHGPQAFLVEAAQLLGAGIDLNGLTNPLALPFSISSTFYASWVPGAGHGFWLQAVLLAALVGVGGLVASRRDHLHS